MRLSVKRVRYLQCLILIILYFSVVTVGFDVYWHTVSYRLDGLAINPSYMLYDFPVPRYFLLSYVYVFFNAIGIPLMWVVIGLVYVPIFIILKNLSEKYELTIPDYIVLQSLFFLCVFYSGLSLSLMYVIAFTFTKKRFF